MQNNVKYCPRCDRSFVSLGALTEHVERTHPDYIPTWEDINDESFMDTELKGYTPETGNGSL